jgi:hypothetical protein
MRGTSGVVAVDAQRPSPGSTGRGNTAPETRGCSPRRTATSPPDPRQDHACARATVMDIRDDDWRIRHGTLSVGDDSPGCLMLPADADIVLVGVVAAAERVRLEPAGVLPARVSAVLAAVAAASLMPERGVAENAVRMSARLAAAHPELTDIGGA